MQNLKNTQFQALIATTLVASAAALLTACGPGQPIVSSGSALSTSQGSTVLGNWKYNPYPINENGRLKYQRLVVSTNMVSQMVTCQNSVNNNYYYNGYYQQPGYNNAYPNYQNGYYNGGGYYNGYYNGYYPNNGYYNTNAGANGAPIQAQVDALATVNTDSITLSATGYQPVGNAYNLCTAQLPTGTFRYRLNSASELVIYGFNASSSAPDMVFTRE